ncbi:MAG: hypothetical protein JWM31_2877 [Solirubrobacterales bacterium]|nr:hypothetical protein [Solirubrobacterales bacterium]
MPRRVTSISLGLALSALALPTAAARAAETYTVDGAAADGCAAKVCRTLTQAVAAVADGDTITVKPGTYTEPAKVTLTKKNVNIVGTAGKTTLSSASTTAGDPVITLVEGDILDGITVQTGTNAGPGVLVTGRGTTLRNSAIIRLVASTSDAPAYRVDPLVAGGVNTISAVTIINGPAGATTQTQPAVAGNATSSLAIDGTVILSGAGNGPAVGFTGNDITNGVTTPNTILRSSLVAAKSTYDALAVTSAATSATKKALVLYTSVLLPGSSAAGVNAASLVGALPGMDTAGDIKITAKNVTIAGGKAPFTVNAGAGGQTAVGNIDVAFDRSILHASGQGAVTSFAPSTPIVLVSGTANTARVAITNSDTTQTPQAAAAGKGAVTVTGSSNTPDAKLFVNLAKQNIHLRADAPVIDKGGDVAAGDATTDIDAQPRKSGPATDLGADEFVNRAPTAVGTVSAQKVLQDQAVTFDASGSSDPEAASGGSIAKYQWEFGDGSTAETTTPTISHAYRQLGLYNARVTVVDNFGAASAAAAIPAVAVADGSVPVVTLRTPTQNGAFAILATTKLGRKARKVLDPVLVSKVAFTGTATDPQGVKLVTMSLRRLAVGNAAVPKSPTACVYLDGKTAFRSAKCTKPIFFTAQITGNDFSYKLKKALKPKAGRYELTVLAIDGSGVFSKPVVVTFKLK